MWLNVGAVFISVNFFVVLYFNSFHGETIDLLIMWLKYCEKSHSFLCTGLLGALSTFTCTVTPKFHPCVVRLRSGTSQCACLHRLRLHHISITSQLWRSGALSSRLARLILCRSKTQQFSTEQIVWDRKSDIETK